MSKISRASVALAAFLAPSLPAAAQMTSNDMSAGQGPSLLWVWGWILVVGIIVFVVGTSLGVRGNR